MICFIQLAKRGKRLFSLGVIGAFIAGCGIVSLFVGLEFSIAVRGEKRMKYLKKKDDNFFRNVSK
jgi:hypothetical protein